MRNALPLPLLLLFALPAQAQEAAPFTNSIGMTFVEIPAGTFTMGRKKPNYEAPPHQVTISRPFYLGQHEVTQAQWTAVMGNNPSHHKGDNLPVEMVSWYDARAFIEKLSAMEQTTGYRLPTEAEWEYACLAGGEGPYGVALDNLAEAAWFKENSEKKTHPVGTRKANAFGVYDLHGNVWEWVEDLYWRHAYKELPSQDPVQLEAREKEHKPLYRGGAWVSQGRFMSCKDRNWNSSHNHDTILGFRLAKDK